MCEYAGRLIDADSGRGLEHSADPEEIDDLENFIKQCLPSIEDKSAAGL